MMKGYSRVTLVRSAPLWLREKILKRWEDSDMKLPTRTFLNNSLQVLLAKGALAGSGNLTVSALSFRNSSKRIKKAKIPQGLVKVVNDECLRQGYMWLCDEETIKGEYRAKVITFTLMFHFLLLPRFCVTLLVYFYACVTLLARLYICVTLLHSCFTIVSLLVHFFVIVSVFRSVLCVPGSRRTADLGK
jgi:hypothetical protein